MQHNLVESTIREELAAYLTGEQSLQGFCDWFFPETWDIHLRATLSAQEMVYEITLLLDEYTSGVWSEADMKEKLRPFVTSVTVGEVIQSIGRVVRSVKATAEQVKVPSTSSPQPQSIKLKEPLKGKPASSASKKKKIRSFSSSWTMHQWPLPVPSGHAESLVASE